MQTKFYPTSFNRGDRVRTLGFMPENQPATFLEYGPDNIACPATHLSWPGMRIAYVNSDKFGRMPIWEKDLVAS